MDFYALNETPINGWATRLGFAEADMSLVVSGKSANVLLGSGRADMVLSAAGDGTRRTFGAGDALLELDTDGDGTRRTFGTGEALFELQAGGDGKVTQVQGGTATLLLTWPEALGGKLIFGTSTATMQLAAQADGRAATGRFGYSDAYMYLIADGKGREVVPVMGKGLAEMWLYPTAAPRLITSNGGSVDMRLLTGAAGRVGRHLFGSGAVAMQFTIERSDAQQHREIRGGAEIDIDFELVARDARVAVLPSTFYPAPSARGMRLSIESRGMRVSAPQRTYELEGA